MTREVGYTIRAMAARCKMTAHTLRYYERVGLIKPVDRGPNGHRHYSDADAAWLDFLRSLRTTHMPIREMRRYAVLREKGVDGLVEQRTILEEHRRALEEQITKLKRALALLAAQSELLEAAQRTACPSYPATSEWEAHVCRDKLPNFETSRGSAFPTTSEPE
jgi:DNA-binding transcriptional MerR regulator